MHMAAVPGHGEGHDLDVSLLLLIAVWWLPCALGQRATSAALTTTEYHPFPRPPHSYGKTIGLEEIDPKQHSY